MDLKMAEVSQRQSVIREENKTCDQSDFEDITTVTLNRVIAPPTLREKERGPSSMQFVHHAEFVLILIERFWRSEITFINTYYALP